MCGIGGVFFHDRERMVDSVWLADINRRQRHRGPDENGTFVSGGIGFAHTRLSIIDLAEGQQPMSNPAGTVTIVFNGEIYNFQTLRDDLEKRGHTFQTRSDTETILEAWQEFGEDCVHHLRGMFAFAIWDSTRQTLFLARDRVGIKPLYYASTADGAFVFGSELKALLVYPGLKRDIDPQAVEDYFTFGYVPEPKTIFRMMCKLSPGHSLTVSRGTLQPKLRQYWDVPTANDTAISAVDAARELVERLREAVDLRLIAEVPLGAFLSGGVDSSSVVALMSEIADEPVTTCSIGFEEKAFNEAHFARLVASRCGTNHTERIVNADDFELIDKLAWMYDEPYADSSAMPTYRVCELAREQVTVALSGDGGDELFAGYRRYRWHTYEERMRNLLPLTLRRAIFGPLGRLYPKADWAPKVMRAKTTFQSLARNSVEAYLHSVSILREADRAALFHRDFIQTLDGYSSRSVFDHHAAACASSDPVRLIEYLDFKTYLVGDILTKVDRASMAHSLEVRVPILDHEFVEWGMSLPTALKLNHGEGKWILKKAMEPKLPNDVLYRSKMGFAVPLAGWFRGPLKDRLRDTLLSDNFVGSGLFERKYLERLIDHHQAGLRDYSAPLWTLSMFEAFARQHVWQ